MEKHDQETELPSNRRFPVKRSEEHACSRRAFSKAVGLSLVAVAGGFAVKDQLLGRELSGPKQRIANSGELAIGDYKVFSYPTNEPCILIRLTDSEYVAYSQSCTHLMCPIHYNKETEQLVCPCHQGFFDAKDGSVISGPPPRAMPRYRVTVEGDEVFVG